MKRRALLATALALLLGLIGLGPASPRAEADDKIPNLTASPMYSGPFMSSIDPANTGSVTFDISRQEGRHFWGVITFIIGGMATPGFEFDGYGECQ